MWSPELETLDQLCGGPETLVVIRRLFESDERFRRAILAMLHAREVRLARREGAEVERWERVPVLNDPTGWAEYELSLTESGARRIG
jgi:hypothetical protein